MNDVADGTHWFAVENVEEIETPALLIYHDRVEENVRRMRAVAEGVERLRPHVKTHKLASLVALQLKVGISKFKAATIAETEMLARAGAADILLAYQPVGPAVSRLLELIGAFPNSSFSCLVDDMEAARRLSASAKARGRRVNVLLDIDCGQHRTGVPPDERALEFYRALCVLPGLAPIGLHAYDGHIHAEDAARRKAEWETAFAPVDAFRRRLRSSGLPAEVVVAGGTPTFPFHAARKDVECSPGTCVLWDMGYSIRLRDLHFLHAALVLTRVVSKPGRDTLCLDLGHKAIASENPPPRVHFLNAPPSRAVMHSEEHLVIEGDGLENWKVGDCLFGVPWHICPTVALYSEAVVVKQGRAAERWRIEARDRRLRF